MNLSNSASIQQVLSQIRAYQRTAELGVERSAQGDTGSNFSAVLAQSLDQVNSLQSQATALKSAYEVGDPAVDLPEVMIAVQKASLAFEATTEFRNKLLNAYQEIMNMQV